MSDLFVLSIFFSLAIIALVKVYRGQVGSSENRKSKELSTAREKTTQEKGYDPYSIKSVMEANNIAYNAKPSTEHLSARKYKSKNVHLHQGQKYQTCSDDYDNEYSDNTYTYQGKSDPVHRRHHYILNEDGRRKRVYDDEDEDE